MPLNSVSVNDEADRNGLLQDRQQRGRSAAGKLLDLIEAMVDGGTNGLTTMEIATSASLDKTTASRLLSELAERGWVERDAVSRRYRPGRVFLGAVRAVVDPKHINTMIYPLLNELRDASGETATLNRKVDRAQVVVAGAESHEPLRRGAQIGDITSLTGGSTGINILAFCPRDFIDEMLSELPTDQRRVVTGQLSRARRQLYLSYESEPALGVAVLSAPVFSSADEVYGALVLSGPSARFDATAREKIAHRLLNDAATVTATLGGSVPPTVK